MVLPIYEQDYPILLGGPLEEPYRFNHVVFHWGKSDNLGSEHAINGKKFPLEIQAVHYNDNYDSYSEALNSPNGIAIVSYLFNINEKTTGDLALDLIQKPFEMLASVPTGEVELDYAFPISLLTPPIYKRYVTYNGSLTLPPCSENVIWIVNYKPRSITMLEMEKFRMLYNNSEGLINNFRPLQMTNQRDIYIVK
nr:carbonic anhydrase 2-like [Onthophagus taurus]